MPASAGLADNVWVWRFFRCRSELFFIVAVVVGIRRFPLVVYEETGVLRRCDGLECARHLRKLEEAAQIRRRARIGEIQASDRQAEVVLDEPQDTAEIVADVADISLRRVSGNHHQRHPEAVLVIALGLTQDSRGSWSYQPPQSSQVIRMAVSFQYPALPSHEVLLPIALTIEVTHEGPPPSLTFA